MLTRSEKWNVWTASREMANGHRMWLEWNVLCVTRRTIHQLAEVQSFPRKESMFAINQSRIQTFEISNQVTKCWWTVHLITKQRTKNRSSTRFPLDKIEGDRKLNSMRPSVQCPSLVRHYRPPLLALAAYNEYLGLIGSTTWPKTTPAVDLPRRRVDARLPAHGQKQHRGRRWGEASSTVGIS